MSGSSELLERLLRYEREHAREVAEVLEEVDEGRLVLNPGIPEIWSANYLEIEATPQGASEIAEIAERRLGPRGYRHRMVVPSEPDDAARLEPGFRELGWTVRRSVYMRLSRPPERRGAPAQESSREETEPIRTAVRSRRPDLTPDSVEQMHVWDERLDQTASARWFAAFSDGRPCASCVLYERDGIGQVETVTTLPELEGRGLASGVVIAAAEASRRAGHELTFLVADADDWPWKLYERLGFDRVGEASDFVRKPPQLHH